MFLSIVVQHVVLVQEERSGRRAAEAEAVLLYAQLPPIERMDAHLSTLTCCM